MSRKDNAEAIRENVDFLEEIKTSTTFMNIVARHAVAVKYNKRVWPRESKTEDVMLRRVEVRGEFGDVKLAANWEGKYMNKTSTGSGAYTLETLGGDPIPSSGTPQNSNDILSKYSKVLSKIIITYHPM